MGQPQSTHSQSSESEVFLIQCTTRNLFRSISGRGALFGAHTDETFDGSRMVSFNEAKHALLDGGRNSQIAESELLDLFEELDTDGAGKITIQAMMNGLRARPFVGAISGVSSLLRSSDVVERVAGAMVLRVQKRIGKEKLDMITLLHEAEAEDVSGAWRDVEDSVVATLMDELTSLQRGGRREGGEVGGEGERGKRTTSLTAQEFNDKYANDASTFEGVYKDLADYRAGVEGSLGLPGNNILDGIKMEFCHSEDSKDIFKTTNYGGTETTPEAELQYVLNPDQHNPVGGGRTASPLGIFLYATVAKKANSDSERYDTALEDLDADTRDGVKTVLLRRVKEAGLTKAFCSSAAETDNRLTNLCSASRLKKLQQTMDTVLKSTPINLVTGQPRFDALVSALEDLQVLTPEEAEGLVERMRQRLKEACLWEEEIVALRLYTGPSFIKLNGTLRESDSDTRKGNNFVCTIFAAVSGMVKLAQSSPIPPGRVVYRGQRGMRLPECFWKPNAAGIIGGTEMAFLSTTTDMEVAVNYAAGGAIPTVFSVSVGAVDNGACLGFLSQYPEEKEVLMPPRSFMEVVGEPSLIKTAGGAVLSIPVKLNCNLLCPTLEKLQESRKTMLVAALEHMRKEIVRDVDALVQSDEVLVRCKQDVSWQFSSRSFLQSIKDAPLKALELAKRCPSSVYNVDYFFRRSMHQALDTQKKAMGKLYLWLEAQNLYVASLVDLSPEDCDRKFSARLSQLKGEKEEKMKTAESTKQGAGCGWLEEADYASLQLERQKLAVRLCRHSELIYDDADGVVNVDGVVNPLSGETALMQHAAEGNVDAVRLLVEARAHVELARPDGMTALMLAAQGGHSAVVSKLVLDGKADPEARGGAGGWTALMYAVENGHSGTVRILLRDCGSQARVRIGSGWTAVHRAAFFGYVQTVQVLVQEGGVDVNTTASDGQTALMLAAVTGNKAVVEWLVKEGRCDVDVRTKDGWTALMWAAEHGHVSVVMWLASEGGADVHAADVSGMTALMKAASKGHVGVVSWLATAGNADVEAADVVDERTAVIIAAEHGHQEVLEWLVREGGADANTKTRKGWTALMAAASNGRKNSVDWLVKEANADVSAVNAMGWRALHCALYCGHKQVVGLMRERKRRREGSGGMEGGESEKGEVWQGDVVTDPCVEAARKDIQRYFDRDLVVWMGVPWKCCIAEDDCTVTFSAFSTVRFGLGCPAGCKAYYELRIVLPVQCCQFGFATNSFKRCTNYTSDGVGDDDHSWGVDGDRSLLWHAGKNSKRAIKWSQGDIVGLACDLQNSQIRVSVNGNFLPPNGIVFELDPAQPPDELFAVFGAKSGVVEYNFGNMGRAFHFRLPDEFLPIGQRDC